MRRNGRHLRLTEIGNRCSIYIDRSPVSLVVPSATEIHSFESNDSIVYGKLETQFLPADVRPNVYSSRGDSPVRLSLWSYVTACLVWKLITQRSMP
jgi:hypothetical protein